MALGVERVEPRAAEAGAASPLDWVRQRRQELQQHQTQEFLLPGWEKGDGHGLFARYRRLGVEDARAILTTDEPLWERNAQLLITACDQVTVRDEQGDAVLAAGYTDPLDEVLDVKLRSGGDVGEARQLALAVFGGNEQRLCEHADDVYRWMCNLAETDAGTLLGG